MTASAIPRAVRDDGSPWPWVTLRIDFETFEAFNAPGERPADLPLIVRWFACVARGECL